MQDNILFRASVSDVKGKAHQVVLDIQSDLPVATLQELMPFLGKTVMVQFEDTQLTLTEDDEGPTCDGQEVLIAEEVIDVEADDGECVAGTDAVPLDVPGDEPAEPDEPGDEPTMDDGSENLQGPAADADKVLYPVTGDGSEIAVDPQVAAIFAKQDGAAAPEETVVSS